MQFRGFLLTLAALFITITTAFGAELKLNLQYGKLRYDGKEFSVSIHSDNGTSEEFVIENLHLVLPKKNESTVVDSPFYSSSRYEAPEQLAWTLKRKFLKTEEGYRPVEEKSDDPPATDFYGFELKGNSLEEVLDNVIVGTTVLSDGSKFLVFAAPTRDSMSARTVRIFWMRLEPKAGSPGRFEATSARMNSLRSLVKTLDAMAIEGNVADRPDYLEFFFFSQNTSRIIHVEAHSEDAFRSGCPLTLAQSGGPAVLSFPANVSYSKANHERDKITYFLDRQNRRIRLVQEKPGLEQMLYLGANPVTDMQGDARSLDPRHIFWLTGFKEIHRYLESFPSTDGFQLSPQFLESVDPWLQEQSVKVTTGSANRNNFSLFIFTPAVASAAPYLKENVMTKMLEAVSMGKDFQKQSPPSVYLKFSKDSSEEELMLSLLKANLLQGESSKESVEGYVILDFTESWPSRSKELLRKLFEYFFGSSSVNIRKTNFLIFANPKNVADLQNELKARHTLPKAPEINLDMALGEAQKFSILARDLNLEEETLHRFIQEVQNQGTLKMDARAVVLGNLEAVINLMRPFVQQISDKISQRSDEFTQRLGRAFLSTLGQHSLPNFSEELRQKVGRLGHMMAFAEDYFGQSKQVAFFQELLQGYLRRGYKRKRPLVITMMGDSGTGKTLLFSKVANYLDGAVVSVNLAEVKKRAEEKQKLGPSRLRFDWEERFEKKALDAEEIKNADFIQDTNTNILELRSDSRPLKFFVIEEAHIRPDLLEQLVPAFGNEESESAAVDFSGIVVVMMMNVKLQSEHYKTLLKLDPQDTDYTSEIVGLFEDSLVHDESSGKKSNEKTMHALATRLMEGMISFPPTSNDPIVQGELVSRAVRTLEREESIRLIVPKGAYDVLVNRAMASARKANFRGFEEALQKALDKVLGQFDAVHPGNDGKMAPGRYLLSVRAKKGSSSAPSSLYIEQLEDSDVALKLDIRDQYNRFANQVIRALKYAQSAYHESLLIARAAKKNTAAQKYEKMEAAIEVVQQAFSRAIQKPFYLEEVPSGERKNLKLADSVDLKKESAVLRFVPEMDYPEYFSTQDKADFGSGLEKRVAELFSRFASNDTSVDLPPAETAASVVQILSLLWNADMQITERSISNSKFRQWIAKIVNLDQADQLSESKKKVAEMQKEFIQTQSNEWISLKEKVAKMHQVDRDEAVFTFASNVATRFQELKAQGVGFGADGSMESRFVEALKKQKERDAESILKELEKKKEEEAEEKRKSQDGCEGVLSLPYYSVERATGWLLAEVARKSAEVELANAIRNARKIRTENPKTETNDESMVSEAVQKIMNFLK